MKGLKRLGMVALLALLATIPALADKASSLYDKARDAEARQNYEQAYDLYKQAYDLKPKDLRYRTAYERTKLYAAAAKVHRGQLLRDAGKLADALAEFEAARQIDPSNFVAQQEAQRTRKLLDDVQRGLPVPQTDLNKPKLSERVLQAATPVELAPISQTPITLKLVEDSKAIYETIGKLAGINVLFDPDYTSRRIRIELNGVTLEQALQIVALESKTFWRPVTPNTIYVAQDSQAKRNDLETQVLRTFYLGNLSASTEIQDVTNTLRTILRLERVQQLPSQNAIVVRGTPDQVAMAEKLINDIDKARPEVVVDVAVMQVQKEKLRNLGITPPFSTTSNPTVTLQGNTSTSTSSSTSTSTTTGTTTTSGTINLNDLANLDARNFVLTVPPMTVTALANDSNTKVLENPQVRALDGQKATLKIGQRVPIATGSFSGTSGVSGLGINPLVNTQFQYTDVGVNIEITPHIHMNRDVTLKISMEISSIVSYSNIGGVNQPIIGQRKIEHEIRLREGEVNVLGGILEETETQSMTGIPWLSNIPILKYFFGQSAKDHVNNEILFALTPRVVRAVDVSDLNTRAIDVGTSSVVQVRMMPQTAQPATQVPAAPQQQPPTQAPAAATPVPQPPQTAPAPAQNQAAPVQSPQASTQQPGTVQQAAVTPPSSTDLGRMGSGPLLSFDPPLINQPAGATFTINVNLTGAKNVAAVPAQIVYDPAVLQLVRVDSGEMLSRDGQTAALVQREDPAGGSVQVTLTRPPSTMGINGDGTVFRLTFMAKAAGKGIIAINRSVLRDPNQQATEVAGSQAVVTVR